MDFNVNSPIIFVFVAIIILFVLAQSIFFLARAIKRAKEKKMDFKVIKKTIISSAIFTIAPAVAILIGVIALSKSLGLAVPWLRLSVIGSLSYETVAANNTLLELGLSSGTAVADASAFVTIVWVMTLGIAIGLILVPLLTKKIQGGMISIEKRDKNWANIFSNAMFVGMISAFLGYVFCNIDRLWKAVDGVYTETAVEKVIEDGVKIEKEVTNSYSSTSGLVPVLVFLVSAIVMVILGVLSKKTKKRWITDYALPISLVVGMAMAIPFTMWLGGKI